MTIEIHATQNANKHHISDHFYFFFREKKPQTNIKDNICIQNLDRIFFIFVEEILLFFLHYISTIYHVILEYSFWVETKLQPNQK